jgi:uncharacterized protein YqjF (DUF2071 family)
MSNPHTLENVLCYTMNEKAEIKQVRSIENILQDSKHRPFPLPTTPWKYYQEWHAVIFAHWQVPIDLLRSVVPEGLDLDLFDGKAWISLVAFSIKRLRPRYLPSISLLSDFHEINLRTYVLRNGKPGIYFLSIEAQKLGSTLMAKLITGLPYMKSDIMRKENLYQSRNTKKDFRLQFRYEPLPGIIEKNRLEKWLTERYCLFQELSGRIYSHDIHHKEWPLQSVKIDSLNLRYKFKELLIDSKAELYHYSEGVQVPTWGKRRV